MQVRIDSGSNIAGRGALARRVEGEVAAALGRFGGRLMRAEVQLGDENADKAGAADKRCSTEARRQMVGAGVIASASAGPPAGASRCLA